MPPCKSAMWNEKLSVFSLNSVYQRGEVFAYLSRFTLVHRQMHTRADSRRRATRNGRRRYIFDTVGHLPVVPPRISINNGRTPLEKAPCSFCVGVAKFIALAGVNFDPCFVRFCFFFFFFLRFGGIKGWGVDRLERWSLWNETIG